MKLSISVALSHKSRLLSLDEATARLDPVIREEILDTFFSVLSNQPVNIERVVYGYSFGIVFALLVPALLYPLVLNSEQINQR